MRFKITKIDDSTGLITAKFEELDSGWSIVRNFTDREMLEEQIEHSAKVVIFSDVATEWRAEFESRKAEINAEVKRAADEFYNEA